MAIHFLETENVYLNWVSSIRVAIFFCFILRALLCRHYVAFKSAILLSLVSAYTQKYCAYPGTTFDGLHRQSALKTN